MTTAVAEVTHSHTTTVNDTLYICVYGWLCDGVHHYWRKPE